MALSRRDFLRSVGLGAGSLALAPHIASSRPPSGEPYGAHLGFSSTPGETMTVVWFTDGTSPPPSAVRWGREPHRLVNTAPARSSLTPGVPVYTHEATMTGLPHDARISYQVGGEQGWSDVRTFRTLPPPSRPVRIVAFGDHSRNEQSRRTVDVAQGLQPHVVLLAGDLSYANGQQRLWDEWFQLLEPLASRVPCMPALGNHDSEESADGGFGFDTYRNRFALPSNELHYSFDAGRTHVVSLEAGEAIVDPALLADELAWCELDLAAAADRRARGELDFIVVLQHFPLWSNHHNRGNDAALIAFQEPLFLRHGIDLLLTGHNHMYERSHPMAGGHPTAGGYVEIITGGGGADLYDFVAPADVQPWSAAYAKRHHVTVLDIDGPTMRVRAIAADGGPEVIDDFELAARQPALAAAPSA
jgi:hypothetical protein